ncbi:hypothetical protein [Paenibacillus larvae]|uniref:hypothetical protein n=1 Tax=Paenibacillus larvae TaxID=1464 RepID=UPI00288EC713|nr:hypothetical protein [Paenibacillus larvae]MDT2194414.1 hypothetical protein [Paenibacillus larvae]MDT2247714.1 hypothetical protein [Paenibacillus larvae]MDT2260933.1 hypothetical protein [Paenibacillus larvae]MDT2264243.1 hypothetical protein [Paenibacillus larvae]MDT2305266.1 hypothetical protein [Paenibacillus larvae]
MNLLIVEDEPRLRSSLAHHIPWSDHGIEVVGLAANGNEALKYVGRKKRIFCSWIFKSRGWTDLLCLRQY